MLRKVVTTLLRPAARRGLPRAAWVGELTREHGASLVRIARSEGLTGDEALDAVQDAALSFLLRATWLELESKPDEAIRLLATLTRNQARNARRRTGRVHEALDAVEDRAAEAESLDEAIERAQSHVALTGCIHTLKGAQRAIVVARLLDGSSGDEVARELGLSSGNVAVTLHRAREQLRLCVSRSMFPEQRPEA